MSVNLVINKKQKIRTRLKPTNYENYKKNQNKQQRMLKIKRKLT